MSANFGKLASWQPQWLNFTKVLIGNLDVTEKSQKLCHFFLFPHFLPRGLATWQHWFLYIFGISWLFIFCRAVKEDEPFERMKKIVKWYLSGFYKKPKGLKKPYNPILGETFRCYWEHPNGSKTFYIAEQVSHHPPISANYVTNRQDGFTISASILAKSKFYGNSTSAILEGEATLSLLPRGEEYIMTLPYAHCKGE